MFDNLKFNDGGDVVIKDLCCVRHLQNTVVVVVKKYHLITSTAFTIKLFTPKKFHTPTSYLVL